MRTSKMPVAIDRVKAIFKKRKFIAELWADFGEPEGVAEYLKKVANSSFLMFLLKKDINNIDKQVDLWREAESEYESYLEMLDYKESQRHHVCYNCPWGNGEGGCTIPGYCPDPQYES